VKIGCVLLAAGAGKRFGGGKLLYEVEGEPMIAHALQLLGSIEFASRVCVARRADRAIQTLAQEHGFAVVINPDPERGVGTSVAIGTETVLLLERELEGILYAVSDQPYLTRVSVKRLLDAFEQNPERIASLSWQGKRGNPAIFPLDCWSELMQLREDVGGAAVIRRHPNLLLLVEADSAQELEDLDTRGTKTEQ
jgi:molybdenum cofactor cytidylyltransferase